MKRSVLDELVRVKTADSLLEEFTYAREQGFSLSGAC